MEEPRSLVEARYICFTEQIGIAVRNSMTSQKPDEAKYWLDRANHFDKEALHNVEQLVPLERKVG